MRQVRDRSPEEPPREYEQSRKANRHAKTPILNKIEPPIALKIIYRFPSVKTLLEIGRTALTPHRRRIGPAKSECPRRDDAWYTPSRADKLQRLPILKAARTENRHSASIATTPVFTSASRPRYTFSASLATCADAVSVPTTISF